MTSRCLSPQQVARFYRIWFALLHYVNERRHLVTPFPAVPGPESVQPEDAMQVRDALWADDTLRQGFIAENPARLDEAIEWPLPVLAQAVLLPFEDLIIYDSLLTSYSVFFGPHIRRRLADDERNAKEREGIITTLLPVATGSLEEQRAHIERRNAKVLEAFRRYLLKAGLSPKMVEQHAGAIQTFAQTALASRIPPLGLLEITPASVQAYVQASGAKATATSFKRFVRFLEETGRMGYEQTEALRQVLKQTRA